MTSAGAIQEILCGYPQRLWKELPLAMLHAYIDDSICKTGDRRLFLAGYIHSADAWLSFTEQWDAALRENPAIQYFKMSEAHARRGQFRKFSEAQRNKKVHALASVIRDTMPWSFHTSLSLSDYNDIVAEFLPFPFKSPYSLLFQAMVFGISSIHSSIAVDEPTRLIFDRQEGLGSKVLPIYEAMFDEAPDDWRTLISGTPQFEDDKRVLPLQAADMLAWHIRREHEGLYPDEYSQIIPLITLDGASFYTEITRETLERLAEAFSQMPRLQSVDKKVWRELAPIFTAIGSRKGTSDEVIKRLFGLGGV